VRDGEGSADEVAELISLLQLVKAETQVERGAGFQTVHALGREHAASRFMAQGFVTER